MKRHCLSRVVLLVTLVVGARTASAQTPCPSPGTNQVAVCPSEAATGFAGTLGYTPEQLTALIQSQVDNLFQVGNVTHFLQSFQNAQAFSSKGLGVDYASETTLVEAGATFSLVSNLDKAYVPSGAYSNPPISGGGMNFSLMGGIGLGLIGLDPIMIFGNWFKGSASLGSLDGSYHNWGVHGQLRLLGPSRKSSVAKFVARWGGIAITSGADYSRMTLSASKPIQSTFTLPAAQPGAPQGSVSVQNTGTITFSLQQTTWTVPLEVTTSLRLLSLITLYGGIGLDFQLGGGSDMNVDMQNASLSGRIPGTTGTTNLGSASISVSQHVSPSPARLREIFGLQLAPFDLVRLFVQVNTTGSSPMLTSLAAGLRVGI
jgi:hypothetical protein